MASAYGHLSGPLVGPLREARRAQIAGENPVWGDVRDLQTRLMRFQQALRRMPGVPGQVAEDICQGLQEFSQDLNNGFRLVIGDSAEMKIDAEDAQRTATSNILEINVLKGEREAFQGHIDEMRVKREEAEDRLAKFSAEVERERNQIAELLERLEGRFDDQEERQRVKDAIIQAMREQVNGRRSLWFVTHGHESDDANQSDGALQDSSDAARVRQAKEEQDDQDDHIQDHEADFAGPSKRHGDSSNNFSATSTFIGTHDDAAEPESSSGYNFGTLPWQPSSFRQQSNVQGPPSVYGKSPPSLGDPHNQFQGTGQYDPSAFDNLQTQPDGFDNFGNPFDQPFHRRDNSRVNSLTSSEQRSLPWSRASRFSGNRYGHRGSFHHANPSNFSGGYERPMGSGFGGRDGPPLAWDNNPNFNNQFRGPASASHSQGSGSSSFRPNAPEFLPGGGFNNNLGREIDQISNTSYGYNAYNSSTSRSQPRGPPSSFVPHRRATPMPSSHSRAPHGYGFGLTPPRGQRQSSLSLVPHSRTGLALLPVFQLAPEEVDRYIAGFTEIWQICRGFVLQYAGDVDLATTLRLKESSIVNYLVSVYTGFNEDQAWSYIRQHMNEEMTRSCLLARAIIDFLVNRVFVLIGWQGFSVDSDRSLQAIDTELSRDALLSGADRQEVLDRLSTVINNVINDERYDNYRKHRTEYFMAELQEMMSSMYNQYADRLEADNDLRIIVEKAWTMSAKILTSRMTWDFRFPQAASRFSNTSMNCVAPNLPGATLQTEHYRIQLVVTPVVTARNESGSNVAVHSLLKANVVCMK